MKITLRQAFATLGVAQGASEDEARSAYRRLALQYHPDKNPHAEATAKFQEISASYKKICDFHRRGGNQTAFFFDEDGEDDDHHGDGHFDDEFGFGGMDFDDLEPTFEEMLMMFEMMFGSSVPSAGKSSKQSKKKKKKAAAKATSAVPAPSRQTATDDSSKASGGDTKPATSTSAPKAAVPLGKSRRRKAPLGKQRGRGGFDDPLGGFMDPEMMMFEQFMGMSMNDPDLMGMEEDLMEEMMHLFAGASDDDLSDIAGGGARGARRKTKAKASGKKPAKTRVESSDEFEDVEEVSDWDDADDKVGHSQAKTDEGATVATGNQADGHREDEPVALESRVLVHGKLLGTVKFIGSVHYSKGEFIGVELDEPEGKNDGTLKGTTYFMCKPRHGVMVRPQDVARAPPSHA